MNMEHDVDSARPVTAGRIPYPASLLRDAGGPVRIDVARANREPKNAGMTILPLVAQPVADPDAWHRVAAPGGYECWHFDAEDASGDVRLVACFWEGYAFHPQYVRRYRNYLRHPTRNLPPQPREYPCAQFALYERGRVTSQFLCRYRPADFKADDKRPSVRMGPNHFTRLDDGTMRLGLRGIPWGITFLGPRPVESRQLTADLTFRPSLPHAPLRQSVASRQPQSEQSGFEHDWLIADPLCQVQGTIRLFGRGGIAQSRAIPFRGTGYHDHLYGTGPMLPGFRRWMRGRVLFDDRAYAFHVAQPIDEKQPPQARLVGADGTGPRPLEVNPVTVDWTRHTNWRLRYPARVVFDQTLTLQDPEVIEETPFRARIVYQATCADHRGTAMCELTSPHRLGWPVLGRLGALPVHAT